MLIIFWWYIVLKGDNSLPIWKSSNALVTQSCYRPWAGGPPVIFAENFQVVTTGLRPQLKNVHKNWPIFSGGGAAVHQRWAGPPPAHHQPTAGPPPAHLRPTSNIEKMQFGGRMAAGWTTTSPPPAYHRNTTLQKNKNKKNKKGWKFHYKNSVLAPNCSLLIFYFILTLMKLVSL